MAKSKNWYWEAEQDRIAADVDLRTLPSPEGWPSDGLDSVGLYFLLLNEMWRSVRVGYLCDPVQVNVPLDGTKLASLVGRDPAVVQRVIHVLLERKMFSKTPEGIVFSRGIIRREELRKKRSKAGKKGGLRSQDLLRQKVEDQVEQTIRIRIGIQSPLNGSDLISLAQKAAFLSGKGQKADWVRDWEMHLSDLLAAGLSAEEIEKELDESKGPSGPRRSEPPWDFKERLLAARGLGKRKGAGLAESARTAADWAKEGKTNGTP